MDFLKCSSTRTLLLVAEQSASGSYRKTPAARATGADGMEMPQFDIFTRRKPFEGRPSEPSRLKVRYS